MHPVLIAAFPVLSLFWSNRTQVSPETLWAPLAVSVGMAFVLFGGGYLIVHHAAKAGLIVSVFLAAFFTYGHLLSGLEGFFGSASTIPGPAIAMAALALLWGLVALVVLRSRGDLDNATRLANLVTACLLVIPLYNTVLHQIRLGRAAEAYSADEVLKGNPAEGDLPSIYYIVLDGYAREDVLRDLYGYDNSAFVEALQRQGFFVADRSRANYAQTTLSLASSLNLRYMDDVARNIGLDSEDRQPLQKMIADSAVSRFLRARGYRFVAFSSGYQFTDVHTADVYISRSSRWGLNAFQHLLLSTTPLPTLLEALGVDAQELDRADLHRAEVVYALDHLADAASIQGPVFVFAHIVSPHPPFAFTREGTPIDRETQFSIQDGSHLIRPGRLSREQYVDGYLEQLQYVNACLEQTVREIRARSSTPPIIIVQADHGPGSHLDWDSVEKTDVRERLSILNAYHVPEEIRADLYAEITPVNSFRLVLGHVFGADLPLLEDRSFFSTWGWPYRFIDVTERIEAQTTP
ncbi:MAG: sulfatase-like hydrolase/transferase [Anaerolineae bacterium]